MISKVIYYAWFGNNELPDTAKKNILKWKSLNPGFEVKEINESNFDINSFSFTKEAYEHGNWAFVSDVARLYTLFNHGGFYFDIDVEELLPIDKSFLEFSSVWSLENSDSIATGLFFGAEKGNPHLKNILDIYKHLNYSEENLANLVTVPIVTKYFLEHGFKMLNKRQVLSDNSLILPTSYFAPFHYWGGGHITKNTHGIHHYKATWVDNKSKLSGNYIKKNFILHFSLLYWYLFKIKHYFTNII